MLTVLLSKLRGGDGGERKQEARSAVLAGVYGTSSMLFFSSSFIPAMCFVNSYLLAVSVLLSFSFLEEGTEQW